jgi:hypothetical protein
MEHARQQQTVTIGRGLFLVRYAAAEDAARPPMIRLAPDPTANRDIGFLLHPDHKEAVLWEPESCLVVRALAPGKLSVEVASVEKGGSAAATVRIEPLSQGTSASAIALANGSASGSHCDLSSFRVVGHIAGTGDRLVKANEWLAGPLAPSRIEGISIDWPDKPSDLEIRYAAKTATPQPVSGRAMDLGSFAGTRGKKMPIVSLLLEMSGAAALGLQFIVEAIFLGAPIKRITGRRVVVSGPTGREPLVGLRLSAENASAAEHPRAQPSASKPPGTAVKPRGSADRVRVFRNRPRIKEPAMDQAFLGRD